MWPEWRFLLCVTCLLGTVALAQNLDLSSGSLRTRSLGGCVAAGSGWWDTPLGNPAALRRPVRKLSWELQLDPLPPLLWTVKRDPGDGALSGLLPHAALLGRAALATRHLSVAFSLARHQESDPDRIPTSLDDQLVHSGSLLPVLNLGLALDDKVSLGLSAMGCYSEESDSRELGLIYGVLVRANRYVDVGGMAIYLPGDDEPFRRLDRLGDRSINVGVQIYPLGRPDRSSESPRRVDPRLLIDMRNVTQESSLGSRQELHLGGLLGLAGLVELRAGVFWPVEEENFTGKPRASAGIGLSQLALAEQVSTGSQGPWAIELGWMQHPENTGKGIWMLKLGWVIRR